MADTKRDVLHGLEGYTAGPWRADGCYVKPIGRELAISASANVGFVPEETRANTELQARAPELVEEIRALREALRRAHRRILESDEAEAYGNRHGDNSRDGELRGAIFADGLNAAARIVAEEVRALLPDTEATDEG